MQLVISQKKNLVKTTELAHDYWKRWIQPGDTVIDATCGNGHDTLALAQLINGTGQVFGYDIQPIAIEKTRHLLQATLTPAQLKTITLHCMSHECFMELSAKAIIYNLGYLPGGEKTVTTKVSSTLKSLQAACNIVCPGGFISVMLYPGHSEGANEEKEILAFAANLSSQEWSVLHHSWLNRQKAPSLLLLIKKPPLYLF